MKLLVEAAIIVIVLYIAVRFFRKRGEMIPKRPGMVAPEWYFSTRQPRHRPPRG
jgi:hypothetical protein